MKILQVVQKPQRRGAEIFAYQLSDRLIQEGHEVRNFYLYPASVTSRLPVRPGDFLMDASEKHFSEKLPGWNPEILRQLMIMSNEFQPDVVQVNAARTVKYGSFLRRFDRRNPWVLVYRNIGDPRVWLRGPVRRWFYKKIVIPKVDGIVAVSTVTLNVLKSFYNGVSRIVRIPRGVDASVFVASVEKQQIREQLETPDDAAVLIFVGSLTSEKRLDIILSALKEARKQLPNLYLWIVGEGPLKSRLQKKAVLDGLQAYTRFLGSQSDVASFVNAADALVLASETEGIPGVVLEAALLRIPAIAPAVGGVPECIKNRETGLLVGTGNVPELTAAIVEMIENSENRIRMGEQAQNWINENFSMEKVAQKYLDFYQDLLQSKIAAGFR